MLQRDPDSELKIDLISQTLHLPDGKEVKFPIDDFAKTCLVEGVDELGYLMRFTKAIVEHESRPNG